ncbi:MAG TPA: NBR1-Ig-like domain-containing protein [Anaerolineales bacterium]|nr:NBR1-Ig-like domain-containing protein [Anaerolineales bacterium]
MKRISPNRFLILISIIYFASACSPFTIATPFIPPTNQAPLIEPTFIITPTQTSEAQILEIPLPTILPTIDQSNCVNNLNFLEDITIPDNSFVSFGTSIDKQWLIENSGTCNWNAAYRLRHTGGALLGAPAEVALFPARSGTQFTIQIIFTAPFEEGVYESAWQAFDPNGFPFGDPIYMRILATP